MTMTEQEAKRYVAAQLAYLAFDHRRAAKESPNLTENTEDSIRNLRDAATVLDMEAEFDVSCSLLNVAIKGQRRCVTML